MNSMQNLICVEMQQEIISHSFAGGMHSAFSTVDNLTCRNEWVEFAVFHHIKFTTSFSAPFTLKRRRDLEFHETFLLTAHRKKAHELHNKFSRLTLKPSERTTQRTRTLECMLGACLKDCFETIPEERGVVQAQRARENGRSKPIKIM